MKDAQCQKNVKCLGLMKGGGHDCVGKQVNTGVQEVALGDLNFNNPTPECYNSLQFQSPETDSKNYF